MTPELDQKLCASYPKIFVNRDNKGAHHPIAWGIECGDGWYQLLDVLCRNIQHHIDWKSKSLGPEESEDLQPVAMQVKEKFGGLRFYCSGGDDTTEGMIRFAESFSFKVCESCGNAGSKHGTGWIFTLCDSCWEKHPSNKKED